MPVLSAFIVENHLTRGRPLANMNSSGNTIRMWFFDVQWTQRCPRDQFKQRIGGLESYNVLDFLKFPLANAINGTVFQKLLLLRQINVCSEFELVCVVTIVVADVFLLIWYSSRMV